MEPTRLEATLAATVAGVSDEIRQYIAAHPDVPVQVSWQPVDGDAVSATGGEGTES